MGRLIIGDNMKKKDKYLLVLIIFLLIFSYCEINSNFRIGGLIRDFIYFPFKKDKKDLFTLMNKEIEKENSELKNLLGIDYSNTDYEAINASVIERNSTYWLDELTINKGKDDKVEEDQIVITDKGMIGKVISVSTSTSKIKLITGFSEPIMVDINNNSKMLFSDNYNLYVKGINKSDSINPGDKVSTLGLSINYPKGILIGEIEELNDTSSGVGLIAKVKLSADINNLEFVSVLKRKDK